MSQHIYWAAQAVKWTKGKYVTKAYNWRVSAQIASTSLAKNWVIKSLTWMWWKSLRTEETVVKGIKLVVTVYQYHVVLPNSDNNNTPSDYKGRVYSFIRVIHTGGLAYSVLSTLYIVVLWELNYNIKHRIVILTFHNFIFHLQNIHHSSYGPVAILWVLNEQSIFWHYLGGCHQN